MAEKLEIIITAKDQTKGVFGNLQGGLGKIAGLASKAAMVGIGALAAGVSGLGVGILALAKDAAQLGPIQEAFEGIATASGVSSTEMLKALSNQSKGLITNTDLMKTYNLAAQLVGDQFANELPDAMGFLSKVSAATGEDMGFLMDSLVRGVGRLSPMILDNLGIQIDLTEAYEEWGEANGVAVSEMTQSQQQMALMSQVMKKLGENTKDLPEMSDPFAQLGVTMTNLKDDVAKTIGPIVMPLIQDLADTISDFVQSDEFQAWIETIADWIKDVLIPAIRDVIAWFGEHLPPVLAFLAQVWQNVLAPALQFIWNLIATYLIPAFESIFAWLGVVLPPVIAFLAQVWETVLKPALEAIWQFLVINVIPGWQLLFEWIGEHLPPVIAFLAQVWETVLKPAIEAIWDFIVTYYIPMWEEIFRWISEKIPPAIQFMSDLWKNVLKPAIDFVYKVIVEHLIPAFKTIWKWIGIVIGVIQKVIGWLSTLANKIKSITLPSWLTPGSPTPFELGLRGIASAMDQVNKSSGFMGNSLSVGGVAASGGGIRGGGATILNLTYAPAVSLANKEEVDTILGPFVESAMRRVHG